jgi:hypothetical protein
MRVPENASQRNPKPLPLHLLESSSEFRQRVEMTAILDGTLDGQDDANASYIQLQAIKYVHVFHDQISAPISW